MVKKKLQYSQFGDDYSIKDPFKKFAQGVARATDKNILDLGYRVIPESRGESALVIDIGPLYIAHTPEGLGTKSLIADAVGIEGSYVSIGIDVVASVANDLLTVGTRPVDIGPHWAVGDNKWYENRKRSEDLTNGWKKGCKEAGAVYGSGESPTLRGIVNPETIELSGAGWGVINPKKRLTLGEKLQVDDHIVIIESSGIHTNGVSLARGIVEELPDKYLTLLPSGRTIGEVLLTPSHIYARLQEDLFAAGVDIHYIANLTGHGAAKLMRAKQDFTYLIHTVPKPQEEFEFMRRVGPLSIKKAYEAFNMGMGFAYFVSKEDTPRVQIAAEKRGYRSYDAGLVQNGPKQVILEPLGITFEKESLDLR